MEKNELMEMMMTQVLPCVATCILLLVLIIICLVINNSKLSIGIKKVAKNYDECLYRQRMPESEKDFFISFIIEQFDAKELINLRKKLITEKGYDNSFYVIKFIDKRLENLLNN